MPGVDRAVAQQLIDKAHSQICPYSNAIRGNVEVNVVLV
jgi:organic hydroperoxide reductase OsmC/OhrA